MGQGAAAGSVAGRSPFLFDPACASDQSPISLSLSYSLDADGVHGFRMTLVKSQLPGLLARYDELIRSPSSAPVQWASSCVNQECSLHQLSPYIGKLKSTIAKHLIQEYSAPGDLVVDPFCGSGTVPLEACCLGRRVFASDASVYATTLTRAKLGAPDSVAGALEALGRIWDRITDRPLPSLEGIPQWVRKFFHPRTLRETLRLTRHLRKHRCHFLLASVLGILHHQRPGFLSFPASNLVPYLRSTRFPRDRYPHLYEYRPVDVRLKAKVHRALRRQPTVPPRPFVEDVRRATVENLTLPPGIDCVITSPPYMNALDYVRDNRLRLWFLGDACSESQEKNRTGLRGFRRAIGALASQLEQKMKTNGYCVFVVGEKTARDRDRFPSRELTTVFLTRTRSFELEDVISDTIPDIRRSRRELTGVKRENILVFRKVQ